MFRYSIRGLAVLTAIIAAGLGWYVTKVRPQECAVNCILAQDGWVAYGDYEISSDSLQHIVRRDNHNVWRGFFATPTVVSLSGEDRDHGDVICPHLASLTSLREAYLDRMDITDVGLKSFAGLNELRTLTLGGSKVTDAGLRQLSGLGRLDALDLSRTGVSDAGLKELAKLSSLTYLSLAETGVTAQGIEILQRALPDCRIVWPAEPSGGAYSAAPTPPKAPNPRHTPLGQK